METPAVDTDVLYEPCPDCEGEANGCMTCWDLGLVVHYCGEE